MPNVLEFALGLQTVNFVKELGFASGEVLSFAAVGEAMGRTYEKVWETIDRGAAMKGMASAVNESVSQLYRFQEGLKAVGGSGDNVQQMFMMTQKALSGVNEMGLRTDIVFNKIGLSMTKLRSEDTVTAITDIAGALAKMNPAQATGVAEMIFGKFGAASVLQMAHEMREFQSGFSESSSTGALLQKFADTFQAVKNDWDAIESDVLGIWVSISGALAPEMHKIFSEVHGVIKDIGPALSGAIEGGHVMELLDATFEAAWEICKNYGREAFAFLGAFLGDTLGAVLSAAFIGLPQMIAMAAGNAAAIGAAAVEQNVDRKSIADRQPVLAKLKGMSDSEFQNAVANPDKFGGGFDFSPFRGKSRQQAIGQVNSEIDSATQDIQTTIGQIKILTDQVGKSVQSGISDAITGIGTAGSQGIKDGNAAAIAVLGSATHTAQDHWQSVVKSLAKAGKASPGGAGTSSGQGGDTITSPENHWKPEFTSLQRMGFVMSGHNAGDALQQRIAHSTDQTATNIKALLSFMQSTFHATNPWGAVHLT